MDKGEVKDDLVQDMIEVLTSFCARLYGRRSAKDKATTGLAKTKSVIVIEDLNVAALMRSGMFSRAVADVGWGNFSRMLEYKTQWYGSKLCSECGCKQESMPLEIREWTCPECGAHHDRDVNAAKNLLHWAGTAQLTA